MLMTTNQGVTMALNMLLSFVIVVGVDAFILKKLR